METSSNDSTSKTKDKRRSPAGSELWPRLIEVWITAVIAAFFLIRVLGSHTAQQFLNTHPHFHLL